MTVAPQIFCRSCGSPLVQASDWEQQDEGSSWYVRLWCPECSFEREALLDKAQASYLSLAIEGGFAGVLESLEELHAMGDNALDLVSRIQTERPKQPRQ